MGLLSDPEYGSAKWVRILKRVHSPLCFVCYICAIGWFFMLANREFNNETYFSENALLPGLVTNEFDAEHSANQFYKEFTQELEDKYDDNDEIPIPWLVGKMSQMNLEVYTHNFSLNYPLVYGQVYKGTNVYGILRAPRTSSLEALVVSAPYRSLSSHEKGTTAGIALMLAFAKFAISQKYWAKDIIFLITEHEQLGMQAWLEAYHGLRKESDTFYSSLGSFWNPSDKVNLESSKHFGWSIDNNKCLDPGTLKGRSGSIQAAINLEFHTPKFKYIEVKVEGLNGQLPNLDLVNLVHKLCIKSNLHHSYKNSFSWVRTRNKMEEWVNNIWTMLGMVSTQIAGVPNGNHGLFHRFNIEALTLEGRDGSDSGSPPRIHSLHQANFHRLGITLESILRSLNNLLERFHQSYFFYMLAATNRFISIGQYMPSLCLLCGAMLIRALSLWVTLQKDDKIYEKAIEKSEKSDNKTKKKVNKDKEIDNNGVGLNIFNMGSNYLSVHLLGYVLMNIPILISYIGPAFKVPTEIALYHSLLGLSVSFVIIGPIFLRTRTTPITYEELSIVNILILIELATACLAIGVHNFSLGLCLAILYTPLALMVSVISKDSRENRIILFMKRAICVLLQPLFIMSILMILYSRVLFPEEDIFLMMSRGKGAAMQALTFSIVDSMIYGNWLYNVVCTVIFPTWLLFWQILCNRAEF